MRHSIIRKIATTSVLVAVAPFVSLGFANADAAGSEPVLATMVFNDDEFANKELKEQDWSKAESALLNAGVAPEDEVFAKLNLAFVYSSTGRRDLAMAIYNDILASKENPYALTVSGQPRRVKTIAKIALARLNQ